MSGDNWVTATAVGTLPPGEMLGLELGGEAVALYNVEGRFYATSNICTHAFTYLTDGYFSGQIIECPLHAGCFDVTDGKGQGAPITCDLKVFPTRILGDEVQVQLA